MALDSLGDRTGGDELVSPMSIAHNSLFTAREKIDLLNQLKSDAAGASQEGRGFGFDLEEIDAAIAEVYQDVQDGVGTETAFKGDF